MAATTQPLHKEKLEVIEWDVPYSTLQNNTGEMDYMDFSKLSINTALRNKLWENSTSKYPPQYTNSNMSPLLDQNHNFTYDMPSNQLDHTSASPGISSNSYNQATPSSLIQAANSAGMVLNKSSLNKAPTTQTVGAFAQINTTNNKVRPNLKNPPLLNSPVSPLTPTSTNERKTPEYLSQENSYNRLDTRRVNESQTVKEELLEMKSIFTRLATQTDDIAGLPEPVQLALKVIELETVIQDKDLKIENLEEKILTVESDNEKSEKEFEFELLKQKKDVNYLKDKLDHLNNSKKMNHENVYNRTDERLKMAEDENLELKRKISMLQSDLTKKEAESNRATDLLKEHEQNEMYHKNEVKKYFAAAREGMERERQDRYLLLVEQNKLKHKVEKLSENCKSYQMKNEELCRIQNELEQECDQFRKLKKIIQEHGLPNHEQLIVLQQQTEMFKDDMLSERKDRERAQAQREKMRRDLEILQSRNQSLQEQVYKYQEHIMRLNTGNQRYSGNTEFNGQFQSGGKFTRQLSSPAYFNPKIRMDATNNPILKGQMNLPVNQPMHSGPGNRQSSPLGNRAMNGGFQNNNNERGRRPPGYNGSPQMDPWQQRNVMFPPQVVMNHRNTMQNSLSNMNSRAPRSPLLGPNGDTWLAPNNPNAAPFQSQPQGTNSGLSYPNNIWSQQLPPSPNSFVMPNDLQNSSPGSSPGWQYGNEGGAVSSFNSSPHAESLGVEAWSTATEDGANNTGDGDFVSNENKENNGDATPAVSSSVNCIEGGFQCGKCHTKCENTEAFRIHIEKCFN